MCVCAALAPSLARPPQGGRDVIEWTRNISSRLRDYQLRHSPTPQGNALARTAVGLLLGAVVGAAYWKLSLWTDVLGVFWFVISVLCLIPFCSIALFSSDRRYFLVRDTLLLAIVWVSVPKQIVRH
jgi:hypothetical protein